MSPGSARRPSPPAAAKTTIPTDSAGSQTNTDSTDEEYLYDRAQIDLADNPFFPKNGVGKGDLCDLKHYFDPEVGEKFSDVRRYHDDDFPVLGPEKQRELIHAYRASASFMDAQVGRLLDELEALGMAGDTALILWGDNGYHLGEQKLWTKVTNFEESVRVPLIARVPGQTGGASSRALVEMVDVYPTICRWLAIDAPQHLQGAALPLTPSDPGKESAHIVNWTGQTVVTDRYRLTFYPGAENTRNPSVIGGRGAYELSDRLTDPQENRNVIGHPGYAETAEALKAQLHLARRASR